MRRELEVNAINLMATRSPYAAQRNTGMAWLRASWIALCSIRATLFRLVEAVGSDLAAVICA